jgi:hypothetical protein
VTESVYDIVKELDTIEKTLSAAAYERYFVSK